MQKVLRPVISAIWLSGFLAAQTLTLRAGRLIQCRLEEPSLSSKTASVGDPILCYLRSAREFGRSAFPRGSYLAGRFSGRLAGKGWIRLEFDRFIFPDTDIPTSAKIIAVRRFRVDEKGKILGGYPRGPRPMLSGEVPIVLRLMDDVDIPCTSFPSCRCATPMAFEPRLFQQTRHEKIPAGSAPVGAFIVSLFYFICLQPQSEE